MNKKLSVGLLGAGYIVDAHAKALKALPHIEIQQFAIARYRAPKMLQKPTVLPMFMLI